MNADQKDRVIAGDRKGKTLPLINADDADQEIAKTAKIAKDRPK